MRFIRESALLATVIFLFLILLAILFGSCGHVNTRYFDGGPDAEPVDGGSND